MSNLERLKTLQADLEFQLKFAEMVNTSNVLISKEQGYIVMAVISKTIVGLPIKNCNHIVIGKIDSVNWETGEWFGRIIVDGSIRQQILDGCMRSIEFIKKED